VRVHCLTLDLSDPGQRDRQILVHATDAVRLRRESELRQLPWWQAVRRLDDTRRRGIASFRAFVSRARLVGLPLETLDDGQIVALLRDCIRRGDLVALGGLEEASANVPQSTSEQRRLVRKIGAMLGTLFTYQGRKYRITADVDLGKIRDRDNYQVTPHREAVSVLHGLAAQPGTDQKLAALLREAGGKVTADWRPPGTPDGLVLLRRLVVVQAVSAPDEPALTPSQLAQANQPTAVIEIELVDAAGQPVPGEAWELLLPDGSTRSGVLDDHGRALVTSLPEGKCEVMFPGLDPEAWTTSGSHGL
jgi:hypothetical protein